MNFSECMSPVIINSNNVNVPNTSNSQSEVAMSLLVEDKAISAHSFNNSDFEVVLSTAKVMVFDKHGNAQVARVLLDAGSQSNSVRKDLLESLGLDVDKINMSIMGINVSVSKSNQSVTITFKSKYNDMFEKLKFVILNQITDNLQRFQSIRLY